MSTFLLLATAILFPSPDDPWPVYKSADGGYSIAFPGAPQSRTEQAPSPKGPVDLPTATLQKGDVVYAITYFDVPPIPSARVDEYLDTLRDGRKSQGRIVREKTIKIDGNPGREVDVESPQTDSAPACLHRVRFFLVKRRVYEMMAVCPLDQVDASAADAKEFLDSFVPGKIEPATAPARGLAGWVDFHSATGRFDVRLPNKPTEESQKVETGIGEASITIFQASDDQNVFMVTYRDVDLAATRKPKTLLDGTRDLVVSSSKGRLIGREKSIRLGRASGREFRAEIPLGEDPKGAALQCRLYLSGRRLYQVVTVSPKDPPATEIITAFFESFHILPLR